MHFIFSPIGSAGNVHPMLGIAVELHRRGYEITFLANGYFRETVEQCGLRFVELGSREYFHSVTNDPDLWNPRHAFRYVFQRAVLPILRGQYAEIEERSKSDDTVVIASCLGFGAQFAHEKLGVPLVTVHPQPAVILSRIEPPTFPGVVGPRWFKGLLLGLAERFVIDRTICPEVNRFRQELGLPPIRQITRRWHSPQLVVCLFPDGSPRRSWTGLRTWYRPISRFGTSEPMWGSPEKSRSSLMLENRRLSSRRDRPTYSGRHSSGRRLKPANDWDDEASCLPGSLSRFPRSCPTA